MSNESFVKLVAKTCSEDDRFDMDAYAFLTRAIYYKIVKKCEVTLNPGQNILTCRETYDGFCEYGHEQMGPLAWGVFKEWGVFSAEDVGSMIYYMIDNNLLKEHEGDCFDQFMSFPTLQMVMQNPYVCH